MTKKTYPKTIGACVDALYELRAKRLEGQKQVDLVKAQEAELEDHIIETFGKAEIGGAKGQVATASIKTTVTATIVDWDTFIAHVAKTKDWELVQKRAGVTAVKERWDDGKEVPGVEPLSKISLSLTKVA